MESEKPQKEQLSHPDIPAEHSMLVVPAKAASQMLQPHLTSECSYLRANSSDTRRRTIQRSPCQPTKP